jgi:hypothetical protein
MSGRRAPFVRFARNVLVIDALMVALVLVLSVWRGWTSLEESSNALFGGGLVLVVLALLPLAGPWLGVMFYTPVSNTTMNEYARIQAMAGHEDLKTMKPPATLTLFAAGLLPIGYALLVHALFL